MTVKVCLRDDGELSVNVDTWMDRIANLSPQNLQLLNYRKHIPAVAYVIIERIRQVKDLNEKLKAETTSYNEIKPVVEELIADRERLSNEKGLRARLKRNNLDVVLNNRKEALDQSEKKINVLRDSIETYLTEINTLEQENNDVLSAYILSVIKDYRFVSHML